MPPLLWQLSHAMPFPVGLNRLSDRDNERFQHVCCVSLIAILYRLQLAHAMPGRLPLQHHAPRSVANSVVSPCVAGLSSFAANASICPASCTSRRFRQPVQMMNGIVHMHGLGKSATVRRFRAGRWVPGSESLTATHPG